MENPDFPQTESQWAYKQIYQKGSNRIKSLQQTDFSVSSSVTDNLPDVEDLSMLYRELDQVLLQNVTEDSWYDDGLNILLKLIENASLPFKGMLADFMGKQEQFSKYY